MVALPLDPSGLVGGQTEAHPVPQGQLGGSSERECNFMQEESDPDSQKVQTRKLERKKGAFVP